MKISLPEGARRVQEFLSLNNSDSQVKILPESTATAKDAANALSVELYQIGKTIVFGSEVGIIVAIVCGDQKVNTDLILQALQIEHIKSLKADEVKQLTSYVIGGVSPFGLPTESIIIIDSRLYNLSECFVAAGHPKAVVRTTGKEIVALTNAKIMPIS